MDHTLYRTLIAAMQAQRGTWESVVLEKYEAHKIEGGKFFSDFIEYVEENAAAIPDAWRVAIKDFCQKRIDLIKNEGKEKDDKEKRENKLLNLQEENMLISIRVAESVIDANKNQDRFNKNSIAIAERNEALQKKIQKTTVLIASLTLLVLIVQSIIYFYQYKVSQEQLELMRQQYID